MVWVLAIILNIPVYGLASVTPLQTYQDPQECFTEEVRVSKGMQDAYPNDKSFKIKCLCFDDKGKPCHVRESTNTITPSMGSS